VSRWLAIVNPAAGSRGATRRLARRLAATMGARMDVAETTAPGEGMRLARQAPDYAGFVAVGGDGTIAEVLNGMDRRRQALALLPAGHGNCLARDLGIASPDGALAAFAAGDTLAIDVIRAEIEFADGRIEERLCASTLAIGYVADVVALGRHRLAWLGRHAYATAAIAVRPRRLRLQVGVDAAAGSRPLTNVVINNTAHLANFRAFQRARLDDGSLDVLESDFAWPRQLLHNLAVLAGSSRFGPAALWQAPSVVVACEAPARLMIDGELEHGVVGVRACCEPAGVRCHVARQ
jgi:diacylglycerol kinase (ATP)